MKNIILYIGLVFVLVGCTKKDGDFLWIDPLMIGKGDLNGSEGIDKQNLVIKNTTDWENLLSKFNNYTLGELQESDINFNTFQLIAVFDQIYGNGGHSIDITKIIENDADIVVTIEHLQKGGISSVITQPYHIVKIPASSKLVIFDQLN